MPRFLHTSDLHINALRKYDTYLPRMWRTLQSILTVARQREVAGIVVAGDLCERTDMTHAERKLLSDWLASSEIPIIAISGNHDKRTEEIGDTCINYLSSLRGHLTKHIIYDGPPTTVEALGIRFLLLPYQGWMDQEFYLILQSLLAQAPNDGLPVVVVLHEAVQGCVNDAGTHITKHHQIRLDSSFPEVTYWALGDMHVHQRILPNAWYSGSPHQIKFDELPYKGVFIVDTDRPTEPEFVKLKSTELRVLTEEPENGWPSVREALVKYEPDINTLASSRLPPNVLLHAVSAMQAETLTTALPVGGIFDGMDDRLSSIGLDQGLFPLAWRIAVKMAHDLGVEADMPEKYVQKELE